MRYKAIIWDLDGTLVDSLPGIEQSANAALAEHGYPTHSPAAIRSYIGDGSWMLLRRAVPEVSDLVIDQITESFKKYYSAQWKAGTKIFPSIPELLEQCAASGIKLSILSNKPHPFTTEIVSDIFSSIPFDIVMGLQDGIEQKPSPAGTLKCIENFQCSANEVLFIGDSTVDLQTAKAAGTASAAVTWGYHDIQALQQEGSDYLATSVTELKKIIFSS